MRNQTEHPLSWHVSFVLHQTVLSQAHTRIRCPDTCRQLKFPSILVPCQEEATREPCLQPLRLLPIQLLMPMSLLQPHAAIFSILIATPDLTEHVLEVVSFLELSVFLKLLSVNVLQEPLQDQWLSPQFRRSCHSRNLSLHCLYLVSRSTHHNQASSTPSKSARLTRM